LFRATPGGHAQRLAQVGIVEHESDPLTKCHAVRDQVAGFAVDDGFLQAAFSPRHDWYARGHRFQRRQPELLTVGRKHGHGGAAVGLRQIARGQLPTEEHAVGRDSAPLTHQVGWAAADDVQRQVRYVAPEIQQAVEALFGRQAANADGVTLVGLAAGCEQRQVHARVDDGIGLAPIELAETASRVAAVGHHLARPAHGEPIDRPPEQQVRAPSTGLQKDAARRVDPVREPLRVSKRQEVGPERVGDDRVGRHVR